MNWDLFVGRHHSNDQSAELAALAAGLGVDGNTGAPRDGVWHGDVAAGTARMYRANKGGWGPLFFWDQNGLTVGSTPTVQKVIENGVLTFKTPAGSIEYGLLDPAAVQTILEQAQFNAVNAMRRRHHYGLVYGSFDPTLPPFPATGQYHASASTPDAPTLKTQENYAYEFADGILQAAYALTDTDGIQVWDAASDVPPTNGIVLASSAAEVAVPIAIILDNIYEIQDGMIEAAGPGNTTGFATWNAVSDAVPNVGSFVASSAATITPEPGFVKNEIYAFGTKTDGAWIADGSMKKVSDGVQQSDLFSLSGDVDRDNVQDEDEQLNTLYEFQPTETGLAWATATTIHWDDINTVITDAIANRITSAEAENIATQIYLQKYQEGIIDYNPNFGPATGPSAGVALVAPVARWKVAQNAVLARRGFNWYTVNGGGAGNWLPR